MDASKIKVGHIYYVDFEPHKQGEFPFEHLALVIKKNHTSITYVVVPLTSKKSGLGVNKIRLGKLKGVLPTNLSINNTYAVIDQVRTVSAVRFHELYENGKEFDAVVPSPVMAKVLKAVVNDLLFDIDEPTKNAVISSLTNK